MFEKIKPLMAEALNLDVSKITLEANLKEDLGIDSLDAVELIMELEEQFNIEISDAEAVNFAVVGDIVRFLEAKVGQLKTSYKQSVSHRIYEKWAFFFG